MTINNKNEFTKIWLKDLYLEAAKEHLEMAKHEHICALGSPDNESATMHEHNADDHREFARMMESMAENIDKEV